MSLASVFGSKATAFAGICAAMLMGAYCVNAAESIFEADFSTSSKDVHNKGKGSFDGVLPESCNENFSDWNASVVKSKLLKEGGQNFLRISVEKIDQGVQFVLYPPALQAGDYKLTIVYRSVMANSKIGLRQLPSPYQSYWRENLDATDGKLAERSFAIKLQDVPDQPGLFLHPGEGDFDIVSVKLEKLP